MSRSAPFSICATSSTPAAIVDSEPFTVIPLDLPVLDAMARVPRETVPDPFDRIIAATALTLDLPLVSADEEIQEALAERVIW
jgi:PIN domain nuclease of toxin-antitoxin system